MTNQEQLGKLIHRHMQHHRWERATSYKPFRHEGFRILEPMTVLTQYECVAPRGQGRGGRAD